MSKWMIPADLLDNEQRDFIFNRIKEKSNQWISGFAGSGKSVLLMHTLAYIKEKEPSASVHIIYFTRSLEQMYKVGIGELKINAVRVTFETYISYEKRLDVAKSKPPYYDYILCDEVQDLTKSVLEKMTKNCGRLYVSGDPNQSIYENDPQTQRPVVNINEIGDAVNANEYKLTTIHRLTQSVIKLISQLIPSMDILKAKKNAKKVDVTARLAKYSDPLNEVEYVMDSAFDTVDVGKSVVVILPTHDSLLSFASRYSELKNNLPWKRSNNQWDKPDYNEFNLFYHKLKIHCIGNGYGDLVQASRQGKVILMTYHSAKGLDFDSVFLPFLNSNADIRGETLFMVGLSRSKETLTLTYSGTMHPYLKSIKDDCNDISEAINTNKDKDKDKDKDDFDFDF
jgi:superfamily I DNA/RNA helicase